MLDTYGLTPIFYPYLIFWPVICDFSLFLSFRIRIQNWNLIQMEESNLKLSNHQMGCNANWVDSILVQCVWIDEPRHDWFKVEQNILLCMCCILLWYKINAYKEYNKYIPNKERQFVHYSLYTTCFISMSAVRVSCFCVVKVFRQSDRGGSRPPRVSVISWHTMGRGSMNTWLHHFIWQRKKYGSHTTGPHSVYTRHFMI